MTEMRALMGDTLLAVWIRVRVDGRPILAVAREQELTFAETMNALAEADALLDRARLADQYAAPERAELRGYGGFHQEFEHKPEQRELRDAAAIRVHGERFVDLSRQQGIRILAEPAHRYNNIGE
jgi:hypothetical protein